MSTRVPGVDPEVSDWLLRRARELAEDDRYPALAQAVSGTADDPWAGAEAIARLTGSGWTQERLNAVLVRAADRTPDWESELLGNPYPYGGALRRIALLSHLSPDEFDAWSAAFGHDLYRLTGEGTLLAIDVWRACVPGVLAPYCAAAGIGMEEATALYATGDLTEKSLTALGGLYRGSE